MIHVSRSSVPKPSALDGPQSKAAKELTKAREHFAKPNPGSFKGFKAYKDQTVKDALEGLFHGKCAYCECVYAANQPVDIEHYRPKSGFVDDQGQLVKPGYWWLAADWDNLLPSCIDCNRARGHKTIEDDEETLGKANQFPIADEAQRWRQEQDPDTESRLLLDPCRDQPERLLVFGMDGEVKAAQGAAASDQAIVRASIKVYGLNRSGLGTVRKGAVTDAKGQMDALGRTARAIGTRAKSGAAPTADQRRELADIVRKMLTLRKTSEPFTALCRQILTDTTMTKLRQFVVRHFADDLKDDQNAAPKPDEVLQRFADRFATRTTLAETESDTHDALDL